MSLLTHQQRSAYRRVASRLDQPGQHQERRTGRTGVLALIAALCLFATVVFPTTAQADVPLDLNGQTVYLVNAETGRYLDADRDGAVRQSLIPNEDDQWVVGLTGSGDYTFRNVQKGRLLDGDGGNKNYDVNLSSKLEADTQWRLTRNADDTYSIRNLEFGRWLDADGASKGYNVDLTTQGEELDARWYIALATETPADLDGAVVLLANGATGRWMSAGAGGSVAQSVAPGDASRWVAERNSDGTYSLRSLDEDRLLHGTTSDVDLNGTGGDATRWRMTQRSDGTYEIQNVAVGEWLDGDWSNKGYNVDLTDDPSERDGRWNVLVLSSDFGCTSQNLDSIDKMLSCVDADDVFVHLEALQAIADANGGVRESGTPGYDASADYVAELMTAAGLVVERQEFPFSLYTENSSSVTSDGVDIATQTMSFSPSGVVNGGLIIAVDHDLGLDNMSSSGCEPEDFVGLDFSGTADIALIQRGACRFSQKAINADAAGAEAVIIFNQGNTEERKGIIGATLGADSLGQLTIPVFDMAYDDALALQSATTVNVAADTETVTNTTENIIADLPGRNPNNVVMAGAHLDSVAAGPGIQDNGSGSAALLAIAQTMANNASYVPQNTVRFAWWGAEESGLIGSGEYVFNPDFGLTQEEYDAIALYLNFDMISSPNFIFGVYDADESTFEAPVPIPPGSVELEDLFEAYYSIEGVPYDDTQFSGRSDYQAFIDVGIPAAGLFTGAEVVKTDQQQAIWGGTAGDQFDPCYHLACDTLANVSYEATEVNVDAVAYALYNVAATSENINGVAGVDVNGLTPADVALDGPQGTFAGELGGAAPHHGHDHDHEHDRADS